ncbi:MAG: hypothetical protein ACYDHW_05195 [Syntrophorhabdaceae bacterium]
MKKILVALLSLILVYSFFRELSLVRGLIILAGVAAGIGISYLPERTLEAMKYPLIVVSFLLTILFFFYPRIALPDIARTAVIFVSFYAVIFYLMGMEDKKQDFFKELTAISILFLTSGFNLYISGKLVFLISFSIALLLFLFIIARYKIMAFIAAYTVIACLMVYRQGLTLFGSGLTGLTQINKYLLLGTSFALLAVSLVLLSKKSTFSTMLTFFGFLYVAMDILMVVGIKLSTGLLYQPILFLAFIAPLAGMMMRTEGRRA